MYAVTGVCLLLLSARDSSADIRRTATLVSPARADSLASPLTFRTIQTKTEPEVSETPSTSWSVGLDSYFRSGYQLYDVPASYAFNRDLQLQLDIPMVSTDAAYASDRKTGLQLGDIQVSVKYRTDVDTDYEAYFILTSRLPSGNAESGAGLGSYDFSFTHKSIFKWGGYRTTFMAGVTIPPPFDFYIADNSVVYSPSLAYMAATERPISSTGFSFGLKAAGVHAVGSRINSELQKNRLTSLDLIPEVTYRMSDRGSIAAGIIVPVVTIYELPGAANKRDTTFNLSVFSYF